MVSTKIFKLELRDAWRLSRNCSYFKDNVFLRIEKDGVVGYGEAAPNVRYGESAEAAEGIIGEVAGELVRGDLFDLEGVKGFLDEAVVGCSCAKAAIDIAVMDWVGKYLKKPVCDVLGLQRPDGVVTSYSIGIDEVEVVKKKLERAEGFDVLKIKVGGDNDEDIIEAVRAATDKRLYVDANEGWRDREVAVRKIEWLAGKGVVFVEQPMPAAMVEETAWVRERVELPIVADEAVLTSEDIAEAVGVYDGINIKLMKAGGILEAFKMVEMARGAGLKVMVGCMIESSVGISAAAQFGGVVDWADLDGNLLISNDPFSGVRVCEGKLVLDDLQGIGVSGGSEVFEG